MLGTESATEVGLLVNCLWVGKVWGEGGRPALSPPLEPRCPQPLTRTYRLDVRVRGPAIGVLTSREEGGS